jgi:aminoglycoside phosphotransferase (APT) family kinase protein
VTDKYPYLSRLQLSTENLRRESDQLEKVLEAKFDAELSVVEISKLGEGTYGETYRIEFDVSSAVDAVVIKQIFPSQFGHDYIADRARMLLLADQMYDPLKGHIDSHGLIRISEERSFRNFRNEGDEFLLVTQEVSGTEYQSYLEDILRRGEPSPRDEAMVSELAEYLARLHRADPPDAMDRDSVYVRQIRESVGGNEGIMGNFDTYELDSEQFAFINSQDVQNLTKCSIEWWRACQGNSHRLTRVHGDFHAGNIFVRESGGNTDRFELIDRSRGPWGEPANDVFCLLSDLIVYSQRAEFSGDDPFESLARIFVDRYLEETGDQDLFKFAPGFLAWRMIFLMNPKYYDHIGADTRETLLEFTKGLLQERNIDDVDDLWNRLG